MKRRRLEDPVSEVGNQPQSSSSSDGNSEEGNSNESGTSAASSHSAGKCSCDDEHSTDESAIVTVQNLDKIYVPSTDFCSSSSKEETSSSEEKGFDEGIREFGLVFPKPHMEENRDIKIVLVGHRDCGKTQLIKSVFGEHPSFTSKNLGNRDEYRITLSNRAHFQIRICDVMDVECMQDVDFPRRTAFLFCYDKGDLHTLKELDDTWIPLFFNNFDKAMLHILVQIERDPATEEMAAERAKNEEEFKVTEQKLAALFFQHKSGFVNCTFEIIKTMFGVFQEAIEAVYPEISRG